MTNPLPTPYDQLDYIPPPSGVPTGNPARQQPAQPVVITATQGCTGTCPLCSPTGHNGPPGRDTMDTDYREWIPGDPGIDAVGDGNARMIQPRFVAPQVQVPNQENAASYAPLHEAVQFPQAQINAGLDRTQVSDMLATESFRRLARRFIDNPESIVNIVRLEPSASGRFQVVIILDAADIF